MAANVEPVNVVPGETPATPDSTPQETLARDRNTRRHRTRRRTNTDERDVVVTDGTEVTGDGDVPVVFGSGGGGGGGGGGGTETRSARKGLAQFPESRLASLYDLGNRMRKARMNSKFPAPRISRLLRDERHQVADMLGVAPSRVLEIADDYRYRVDRAGRDGGTFAAPPLNPRRLKEWQSEHERAIAPSAAAITPATPAAGTAGVVPGATEAASTGMPSIDTDAHAAATSPSNALPEPSREQKEAGNYKKGHINLGGLDISVENPQGSQRRGTGPDGKAWSITMRSHYGYFRGTVGRDKDHIDTFIRPGTKKLIDNSPVFVVDQVNPSTSRFDCQRRSKNLPDGGAKVGHFGLNGFAGGLSI